MWTPSSVLFPSLLLPLSVDPDPDPHPHPRLKLSLRNGADIYSKLYSIDPSSSASDDDLDVDSDGREDVDGDAILACASSIYFSER